MEKEESLFDYYKIDFDLTQYGNFSISDLNELFPYEKEIYMSLLIDKLKREDELRKQARAKTGT